MNLSKESPMCGSCASKDETQLSSDRDKWPIGKIENGCFDEICKLLDLAYSSKDALVSALGSFDQTTAAGIKITYEVKGGLGTAEEVLGKWGSSNQENNVGALIRRFLKITCKGMMLLSRLKNGRSWLFVMDANDGDFNSTTEWKSILPFSKRNRSHKKLQN
ncbi:Hypothetical predicted protein [Paramuricea clavata]|uniref:Uncharacterized protein n=1 Tax=Paramuricea clavata TaxID=317549 RepID=A0A7D9KZ81_PARCT|nr:Hypothetical predicted protein [Paramuricea clavata]